MTGAVFFVILVGVVLLVLIGVASPIFLVPLVVIGLGLLTVPFIAAALRGSAVAQPDAGPSDVPTTREAAYDPVREPRQQPQRARRPGLRRVLAARPRSTAGALRP